MAEILGQGSPGDVMDREIVKSLQEAAVVATLGPSPEHEAANTRSTVAQSSSIIPVSMVAPPEADLT